MDALRSFVNELFIETFYEIRKKKWTFLTTFYISYESDIQIFLK